MPRGLGQGLGWGHLCSPRCFLLQGPTRQARVLPVGAALLNAHHIQVLGIVSLGRQQELIQVCGQFLV